MMNIFHIPEYLLLYQLFSNIFLYPEQEKYGQVLSSSCALIVHD